MKNILFTLFAILILTSCSKDDDNWIELNENNIVGNWGSVRKPCGYVMLIRASELSLRKIKKITIQ